MSTLRKIDVVFKYNGPIDPNMDTKIEAAAEKAGMTEWARGLNFENNRRDITFDWYVEIQDGKEESSQETEVEGTDPGESEEDVSGRTDSGKGSDSGAEAPLSQDSE